MDSFISYHGGNYDNNGIVALDNQLSKKNTNFYKVKKCLKEIPFL